MTPFGNYFQIHASFQAQVNDNLPQIIKTTPTSSMNALFVWRNCERFLQASFEAQFNDDSSTNHKNDCSVIHECSIYLTKLRTPMSVRKILNQAQDPIDSRNDFLEIFKLD